MRAHGGTRGAVEGEGVVLLSPFHVSQLRYAGSSPEVTPPIVF